MSRSRHRKDDDAAMGLIVLLLLIVFALPLVGLYYLLQNDPSKRGLGVALLVIGIILWIIFGVAA